MQHISKCKFPCINNYYIETQPNLDISNSTGMEKPSKIFKIQDWIFKILGLNTHRNRTFSSLCISMAVKISVLKISVLKISKLDLNNMNKE